MKKARRNIICAGALLAAVLLCIMGVLTYTTVMKSMYPLKETALVEQYAQEYALPPSFVYAVMNTESGFRPDAVSDAGALGIMQMTPDTFAWLQTKTGEAMEPEALFDKETGTKYGCLFLRMLLDEFGDMRTAAAAYHAGRGQVNRWLDNSEYSKDGKQLDTIPTSDTAHYVHKVTKAEKQYRSLYQLQEESE